LKKRLCAALLAGLMAFSAIPASAASANMKLDLSYPDGLSPGDTFSVEVRCEDNPGLCAFQFTLSFDQDVLDCTDVDLGPVLSGMMAFANPNAPDGAIVVAASAYPSKNDGIVATFQFNVLTDGDYDFLLDVVDIADSDEQTVSVSITYPQGNSSTEGNPSSGVGGSGSSSKPSSGDDSPASEETAPPTFTDAVGHWAEDYILEAAERGLAAGVGNNLYGCEMSLTRAQFVTMLWANAGKPKAEASTFTDLTQDWYRDAVNWAAANGYVAGYEDNTFRPETKITREQVAVILRSMWVKAGNPTGMELMFAGIYDEGFDDSAAISLWAKNAVYWAVYKNIWCGTDGLKYDTILTPKAEATRAQFAVMLVRFLDL